MTEGNVIYAFRREDGSVTGRDHLLLTEALAQAIATIEALPDIHRPESNLEDMRMLLRAYAPQGLWREMVVKDGQRRVKILLQEVGNHG